MPQGENERILHIYCKSGQCAALTSGGGRGVDSRGQSVENTPASTAVHAPQSTAPRPDRAPEIHGMELLIFGALYGGETFILVGIKQQFGFLLLLLGENLAQNCI